MKSNENKQLINSLLLSFVILGVIAFIGIGIWKRQDFFFHIMEIFNPSNLLFSSLVGLLTGAGIAVFVLIISRLAKTKFPKNEATEMLLKLMNKPYGPLLIGVLPGIFEELLFRGFLLAWFLTIFDPILAIILSSAIFWLAHVPQYKSNIVLNGTVIVLSLIISYLFVKFGTLWAPIALHMIYNYLVALFVQKKLIEL